MVGNLWWMDGRVLWRRVDAVRPRPGVDTSRNAMAADSKMIRPLTTMEAHWKTLKTCSE